MSITPENLERRVADLTNLPTLPGVVKMLTTMVENEKTSAADMGDVIAKDQVLSAKLLRLVNSPIYGFPGRISSVTHAIVLLGFNVVKGLVLGTAVFDKLARDAKGLWEHSLGCAVLSRRIAKERGLRDAEEIMVAGLLHDLGKVVMSFVAPVEFGSILGLAESRRCHVSIAEREVLGVDHTGVAEWITRHWHLPLRLSDALVFHHAPLQARFAADIAAIVHLADILARGMGYGYPGDPVMPALDHEAFQSLGLSFEQIDRILLDAELEYRAGVNILNAAEGRA